MKFEANKLKNVAPYKITPQDIWGTNNVGNILKLDWNEAPTDVEFYNKIKLDIMSTKNIMSWYPDYECTVLQKLISETFDIPRSNISVYDGSDSALRDICTAFLDYSDHAVLLAPTYDNFRVYVQQNGAEILDYHISANNIEILDLKKFISAATPKIVYIVNPNNPFGTVLTKDVILDLIQTFSNVLFVVDEAYIDLNYSNSMAEYVTEFNNLLVTRTFSKMYGLAGLRIGYVMGHGELLKSITKIRNGKNINMIAQQAAVFALRRIKELQLGWFQEIIDVRSRLEQYFSTKNIEFYKSEANFILFFVENANEFCAHAKAEGIYLRSRHKIIPNGVRITVPRRNQFATLKNFFDKHL